MFFFVPGLTFRQKKTKKPEDFETFVTVPFESLSPLITNEQQDTKNIAELSNCHAPLKFPFYWGKMGVHIIPERQNTPEKSDVKLLRTSRAVIGRNGTSHF